MLNVPVLEEIFGTAAFHISCLKDAHDNNWEESHGFFLPMVVRMTARRKL
jgi:hypothetical protein